MTISGKPEADVVIVGCGPVGALAACLLGKAGLSVIVLEREQEHYPLPRAVHIDHEMMRLFQSAGVIDRIVPRVAETDGHLHIGTDSGVIRYMGTVGRPRPFGWANDYFFYQPELETSLREAMLRSGNVELRQGAEFVGLQQVDGMASTTFLHDRNTSTITSRWVIGCDGSRSSVRKHLGIGLDDLRFDEPWLVVDAEVAGEVVFPEFSGVPANADLQRLSVMLCDTNRPTTIVPGRGNHRRWEFMLLPGEDDQEMMAPAKVAALVRPYLEGVSHRIIRAATYRFHGLVAEQWQQGNVFLAGDAAHQTPPFFGQGLCHGFRDVANLAWKMEAILKFGAPASLLDAYQTERDPHVRAVIEAALAAGRYICELDPQRAAERDSSIREQATSQAGKTAGDLIPAIRSGIVLAGSAAAGERFIQPVLEGGRLLDDVTGQGWRLFVRNRAITGAAHGIAHFVIDSFADNGALEAWLDQREADAVLVRPDHYVFGTARGDADGLIAAMQRQLAQQPEMAQ